jgi:hypothetical protein
MARFENLTKGSCIDVQSLHIRKRLCHRRGLEDVIFVKSGKSSEVIIMRVPCRGGPESDENMDTPSSVSAAEVGTEKETVEL